LYSVISGTVTNTATIYKSNSNINITTLEIPQHFVHNHVNLHNQTRSPTGSMATSVVVSSTGQPVFKPHFHLAMFVVESE